MARVSVAVPVRNGARYLEEAIDAILNQTYSDLEIVISDNASTDDTPEICRRAAGDSRVTYYRHAENRGALANFASAFELTTGELFCWAAHDDRMHPDFIRRCVEALDRNPGAAMCVTSLRLIGADGEYVGHVHEGQDLASPFLSTRLRSFLNRDARYLIYGVYRRHVLNEVGLLEPIPGTDVLLVWNILLRHRLCVVEDELFEYRTFLGSGRTAHLGDNIVAPAGGSPRWRFLGMSLWTEMWAASADRDLSREDRRIARRELLRWLATPYWRSVVYKDLAGELAMAIRSRRWHVATGAMLAMGLVRPLHSVGRLANRKVVVAQLRNATRGSPEPT